MTKQEFSNVKGVSCLIAALFLLVSCVGGTVTMLTTDDPPPPTHRGHDR